MHSRPLHNLSTRAMKGISAFAFVILLLVDTARAQRPELVVDAGHIDEVLSVAFSPDWRTLASGSADETIKLWDIASGLELRTLTGHSDHVSSVAVSPDGRTLASGGHKTIKLFDVASGRELRNLAGHTNWANSVAFSPDEQFVVSASDDGSIRIWTLASGEELGRLVALDKDDWALADPKGRFDASPRGMQLMHWVVERNCRGTFGLEPDA
jgi:WD40 repeat protein